ncbi:MAG: ATP cone domain-containing protein [Candidatus Aenigmatarchaeota archaeon]
MKKEIYVTKASGDRELFNENKIYKTIIRSGASKELANLVLREIKSRLYDGISTREIIEIATKILEERKPEAAAKYNLKYAIMALGPAGYTFENYFAEILNEYNYKTRLRQIVSGGCVNHEIDIIAEEFPKSRIFERPSPIRYMIELKYHNISGIYTGLKEVLYTYARFLDLIDGWKAGKCEKFDKPWLVCNTKFSLDAIQYANCKSMKLLGWRFPAGYGLEVMIEKRNLYPITLLRNLDKETLNAFSNARFMLLKDLFKFKPEEIESKTGINKRKIIELIQEAKKIMV